MMSNSDEVPVLRGDNLKNYTQTELEKVASEHRRDDHRQPAGVHRTPEDSPLQDTQCTPVSRIPDDVLKLIFEETYQPCHMADYDSLNMSGCDPLAVTHVSRRWRDTALSLPTIWTCLHVERRLHVLKLRIQRSGTVPLRIVELVPEPSPRFDKQIALLVDHAHRWKSVYTLRISGIISRLLEDPQDRGCAALTQLDFVDIYNFGSKLALASGLKPIVSCPNLVSLSLSRFKISFIGSNLSNLRCLTVKRADIAGRDLTELSIVAPQLVELTLANVRDVFFDDGCRFTLPALKTLRFLSCTAALHNVLNRVEAPSLDTVICERNVAPHLPEDITTYPCLTRLRRLQITRQDCSIHADHILCQTPSLTSLEITDCRSTSLLLGHLGAESRTDDSADLDILLPKLETFAFEHVEPTGKHCDALLRIVQRRTQLGLPLRELMLGPRLMEALDPDLLQTLSELVIVSDLPDWLA